MPLATTCDRSITSVSPFKVCAHAFKSRFRSSICPELACQMCFVVKIRVSHSSCVRQGRESFLSKMQSHTCSQAVLVSVILCTKKFHISTLCFCTHVKNPVIVSSKTKIRNSTTMFPITFISYSYKFECVCVNMP